MESDAAVAIMTMPRDNAKGNFTNIMCRVFLYIQCTQERETRLWNYIIYIQLQREFYLFVYVFFFEHIV